MQVQNNFWFEWCERSCCFDNCSSKT